MRESRLLVSLISCFLVASLLVAAPACSGSVDALDGDNASDGAVDAPDSGVEDAHADTRDGAKDTGHDVDGADDAFEEYVDPGCPDAPAPVFDYQCDPLAPAGECPEGEGCYPYVEYPWEPCGAEIYGSMCLAVGTGTQGEGCYGTQECAAGFVCVVSGSGNQCVKICSLTDPSTCTDGQVCEPLDVAGLGGCL
jgi:hypothetical protein